MAHWDALIVGAGHNGLAAAATLAKHGRRVLVLEKNDYVGGMAGSREILPGCRNDVGASLLFPLAKNLVEELEFERYGAEFIDLPIMSVNVGADTSPPLVLYRNPLRQAAHVLGSFGPGAMWGFVRLMRFCQYPASVMDRFTPRSTPRALADVLAEAPSAAARAQLTLAFTGSAMDLIDRFLPDRVRHRTLRAMLAFAAIQSTFKGPYTPGSALCLVYTLALNDDGGLMRRVKGGMGSLSEALQRAIEARGGVVRLRAPVRRIVVEHDKAIGVELRNGERITARAVLSNLDKPATFLGLVGEEHLPADYAARVRAVEHRGAYMHVLFKLRTLPEHAPPWTHLNRDPRTRFLTALVPDPEEVQAGYEACVRGEVPALAPISLQIPTVLDPTLAPPGYHIGTSYGFYFPCDAPREERGRLRDAMAERIVARLEERMPGFRSSIVEQAVFSSDHFATMHGATNGDFTHGLIHPEQMIGGRATMDGSAHATPIAGLYLCGAACHPGPGVTFLPGYGAAHALLADWAAAPAAPAVPSRQVA
jgi:phytoene dehydrogenase-like protein